MKPKTRDITIVVNVRSQCGDADVIAAVHDVLVGGLHPKSLDDDDIEVRQVREAS